MTDWKIIRARPPRKFKELRLYASLNKRGEIVLNRAAWETIGDPATVALLYLAPQRQPGQNTSPLLGQEERILGKIGVKYPVAIDRHFFPLRRYGRQRQHRIVRAARLLKQFDITVKRTVVFCNVQAANFDGSPMLVLDLNSTRTRAEPRQITQGADAHTSGTA